MADPRLYMNTVNGWEKMGTAVNANDPEVAHLVFKVPELRPYLGRCRFGNCAHVEDDGCAVKEAVVRGEVDERRYLSYVKLFTEG